MKRIKGETDKSATSETDKVVENETDNSAVNETDKPEERLFINRWGKDVRNMDAETLYDYIGFYEQDSWKDSPEFQELSSRLHKKSLIQLIKEGYFIPNWKTQEDRQE